ncbi:MAG: DUF4837 family protein [Flavobacteriales bacterium]
MTLKPLITLFVITALGLLTSCEDESTGGKILPSPSGRHAEILVVADSALWATQSALELQEIYQENYPLLNKAEPFFNIVRFKEDDFSSILKTHMNILILTKSDSVNELKTYKNRWAQDQQVLFLKLKNDQELLKTIQEREESLFNFFYKADLKRIAQKSEKNKIEGLYKDLIAKKGFELAIPQNFFLVKDTTDFIWARREKPHLTESITYYEEDYTNENQFSLDHIIHKRDSLYKNHVEGSVEGSYMATERRFGPIIDTISINNTFATRTRGWWKMKNDYMGGYFIRYSIPDLKRRKIIHLEAFLYCPKYNKMFYLRELEAILNRFKINS